MSKVIVTPVRATGLAKVQSFGVQDPYVRIKFGNTTKNTQVHNDGGSSWNNAKGEAFEFSYSGQHSFVVQVMNKNTLSDSLIGEASIALGQLQVGTETSIDVQLRSKKTPNAGVITLKLQVPNTTNATIAALEEERRASLQAVPPQRSKRRRIWEGAF